MKGFIFFLKTFLISACVMLFTTSCSFAPTKEPVRVLSGHAGVVMTVAYSPDGTLIASGSSTVPIRSENQEQSGEIFLWNSATGEKIREFKDVVAQIRAIEFSADGATIIAAEVYNDYPSATYSSVKEWDVASGDVIRTIAVFDGDIIESLALSPDNTTFVHNVFIGGAYEMGVYSYATGEEVLRLEGKVKSYMNAITYSHDGARIAAGAADASITVWDAQTGKRVWTSVTGSDIDSISFSPDDSSLIIAGSEVKTTDVYVHTIGGWDKVSFHEFKGGIAIVDSQTGVPQLELAGGFDESFSDVRVTKDGRHIISTSTTSVKVWGRETGSLFAKYKGHTNPVNSIGLPPSGNLFATASHDGTVIIWNRGEEDA